jgi:hypothetical protein
LFFLFIALREQSREVNMLIFICLSLITDDAHNECIYERTENEKEREERKRENKRKEI